MLNTYCCASKRCDVERHSSRTLALGGIAIRYRSVNVVVVAKVDAWIALHVDIYSGVNSARWWTSTIVDFFFDQNLFMYNTQWTSQSKSCFRLSCGYFGKKKIFQLSFLGRIVLCTVIWASFAFAHHEYQLIVIIYFVVSNIEQIWIILIVWNTESERQ